jgi:hypothetical protein
MSRTGALQSSCRSSLQEVLFPCLAWISRRCRSARLLHSPRGLKIAPFRALFVSQAVLVQLAQAHAKWRRGKVSRTTSTLQACTCDFPGLASCTCQEEPALLPVLAHGALDMSQSIVTLAFALAEARIRPPAGSLHGTGPHKRGVLVIIALPHQVVYELALDSAYLRDLKQINAKCMREARCM